jgi:flagellar hook assembly protein FlgD
VTTLHQNVPNPFNPSTKISFDLSRAGHVKLQVFDVAGHLVKTLANAKFEAKAKHEITWNGLDEAGRRVPSGVYFYQLVTDDFSSTKKMVVLK